MTDYALTTAEAWRMCSGHNAHARYPYDDTAVIPPGSGHYHRNEPYSNLCVSCYEMATQATFETPAPTPIAELPYTHVRTGTTRDVNATTHMGTSLG